MANEGLMISGTVAGRAKKHVGEKNTELITYKIIANGKEYYVKDWNPDNSYFKVGEAVVIPLALKIYQRNGQASLDYSILKEHSLPGDEF